MSEFAPVETLADLDTLDGDEILEGYLFAINNPDSPEPGSDRSRSFWHGWRNGKTDKGRAELDVHQQRLVVSILGNRVRGH